MRTVATLLQLRDRDPVRESRTRREKRHVAHRFTAPTKNRCSMRGFRSVRLVHIQSGAWQQRRRDSERDAFTNGDARGTNPPARPGGRGHRTV